jgi:hypothetical protein
MWYIVTPKVFICFKILLWNFLNSIDIYFSVDDFMLMGLYFSVLLLWFIEFVKKIDIHKMAWIVQKWSPIPMNMSKFYIIKCCQAFLAVTSSFKSHCLYICLFLLLWLEILKVTLFFMPINQDQFWGSNTKVCVT